MWLKPVTTLTNVFETDLKTVEMLLEEGKKRHCSHSRFLSVGNQNKKEG